jgi:hypothetical protein
MNLAAVWIQSEKDSVWNNLFKGGRNTQYQQSAVVYMYLHKRYPFQIGQHKSVLRDKI